MIKAMRTVIHEMLPLGISEFNEEEGDLIGNINTGKVHAIGCRAIGMMLEEHKKPTNGDGFEPCGWCKGGNDLNNYNQYVLDHFHNKKKVAAIKTEYPQMVVDEDPEDIEICRDPRINKIFKDSECMTCGHTEGTVKMYPAEHGVRLLGDPHKRYWIYKECSHCGYQTSLRKLKMKS